MESFTSKNCQKLNNHFSVSRARKWTVTICLILKEFLVREGVALEPWLEQPLEQLFPFSRNTFYLQQKGRDVIESAIPEIGGQEILQLKKQ